MTALRGIPSHFGYAPAREAEATSRRALGAGLASGSLLLGLLYAAAFLVLPLLPRMATPPETAVRDRVVDILKPPPILRPIPSVSVTRPSPGFTREPVVVPDFEAPPEVPVAPAGSVTAGPAAPGGEGTGDGVAPATPGTGTAPGPEVFIWYEEAPAAVFTPKPEYPDLAREAGVEGTVLLLAWIRTDGGVGEVRVKNSIPLLDGAAVAAVKRWRFTPALASGRAVAVWVSVPVRFSLR